MLVKAVHTLPSKNKLGINAKNSKNFSLKYFIKTNDKKNAITFIKIIFPVYDDKNLLLII